MASKIDSLSNDILLLIFRYFDFVDRLKLESVCQKWRSIISSSYQDIKKLSMAKTVNFQSSACLDPFYKALRICGFYLIDLHLDLKNRFLDRLTIDRIRTFCNPRTLRGLHFKNVMIENENLLNLVEYFSNLSTVSLSLMDHSQLDDTIITSIIDRCDHLIKLNFEGRNNQNFRGQFLHHLRRSLYEFRLESISIDQGALTNLLKYDLHLEILSLKFCQIDYDDLLFLCRRAMNLKELNISRIKFKNIPPIKSHEPILFTAIGSLRYLRKLYSYGLSTNDECLRVLSLTNRPTSLKEICLGANPSMTDTGVLHMANFIQLTRLDLSHIDHLHDWSLIQLVCAGVNKLTHFFACRCKNIDGSFLKTFLTLCPNLVVVGVYGCAKIGDTTIGSCIDILIDRRNRFTLCIGETNVTVANLISNIQFRDMRLNFDWSSCNDHGHDC